MKILYFGSFDKIYDTETYIANTLELLGNKVIRVKPGECDIRRLEEILQVKYDFVLLSKGWFNCQPGEVEKAMRDSDNVFVGWYFDLSVGTKREWQVYQHHVFKADIVLTTDGGHQEWFDKRNINHVLLRQGIYLPEAFIGDKKADYDIIFVGSDGKIHKDYFNWDHRIRLLKFLQETYGERFHHFGKEDGVRNKDLNDLFASSKIVIGDSVYSPNYWSNRLYESLGRGAFLIFPTIDGLENEFIPGKHFVPYNYNDFEGLKNKIDYYLDHPEERELIKVAGFNYCKNNHTYAHRCKELIKIVNDFKGKTT